MTSPADVELTRRYQRALGQLRQQFGAHAAAVWAALPAYNEADLEALVAGVRPVQDAARRRAANLASGYIGRLAGVTIPIAITDLKREIDPVWRQPFMTTWGALARGVDPKEAVLLGLGRASSTAGEIVTFTARDTTQVIDDQVDRIVGWNRVPSGDCCAWCADVAATDYSSAEAAALDDQHANCNCDIVPITDDSSPGADINAARLDDAPDDADYIGPDGEPADRPDA